MLPHTGEPPFVPSATLPMPVVLRMPMGSLLVPVPLIAAASSPRASTLLMSLRKMVSMSGVLCSSMLRLNSLMVPRCFGRSDTRSKPGSLNVIAVFSATQYAVTLCDWRGTSTFEVRPVMTRAPASRTFSAA